MTNETETAKDILQLAAQKAETIVEAAAATAETNLLHHDEERTEAIAERAASKAIDGFFMRLGVDTTDPLSMQKDFAHLRAWRESTELVRRKSLTVAVSVIVTGILALIYAAISHRF